jgi:hypothetical protein
MGHTDTADSGRGYDGIVRNLALARRWNSGDPGTNIVRRSVINRSANGNFGRRRMAATWSTRRSMD